MTKKKGSDNHIFRYDELEYSSGHFNAVQLHPRVTSAPPHLPKLTQT